MDIEQSTTICSSRLAKLVKIGFFIIVIEIIVISVGAGLIFGIHGTTHSNENETLINPADATLETTLKGIDKIEFIM